MTAANGTTIVEREPVAVFLAGLTGLVDAAIVAATALDWVDLTAEQAAALVGFVTVAAGLIGGVLRANVWAPANIEQPAGPYL